MNEIIRQQPLESGQKPLSISVSLNQELKRLKAALMPEGEGKFSISTRQAPTPAARAALASRAASLIGSMQAGDASALRREVAALVGVLPSPTTDSGDAETKINLYCAVLSDLPTWAAREACGAALRGKIGNYGGRFLPAPGELHTAAVRYLDPFYGEKAEIDRVLNAEVVEVNSEDDRKAAKARVSAIVEKTTNMLQSARPINERRMNFHSIPDAPPRAKIDHTKPPILSGVLRTKLDLKTQELDEFAREHF